MVKEILPELGSTFSEYSLLTSYTKSECSIPNISLTTRLGHNLTNNAYRFIDRIQELVGREFILFGKGPGEKDIVEVRDLFELKSIA